MESRFLWSMAFALGVWSLATCAEAGLGSDRGSHSEAFRTAGPVRAGGLSLSPQWVERVLFRVIAKSGSSKRWDDLLELDGGTVGIANFAASGLRRLYEQMDTEKFFARPASAIPDRPYRYDWWRQGLQRFFRSSGSQAAQVRAWHALVRRELGAASSHGWRTERALAIAAGIANSGGFTKLAEKNGWDPERTLQAYASKSAHRARRRDALDREFPRSGGGSTRPAGEAEAPAPARVGSSPSSNDNLGAGGGAVFGSTAFLNRFPRECQYGRRRGLRDIRGVVLHEGTTPSKMISSERWQKECVSTHFAITRDGTVHQMMDLAREAHHASEGNRGSIGVDLQTTSRRKPGSSCSQSSGSDPNDCTYSAALLDSLNRLLRWIASRTSVGVNPRQVVGHFEVGHHGDPRGLPWQRLGIDGSGKRPRGWTGW